jgi:hypothetical protein
MRRLCVRGRSLDMGLGWFRRRQYRTADAEFVEHLGGGAGFWSVMRIYSKRGVGVVVMGTRLATTSTPSPVSRSSCIFLIRDWTRGTSRLSKPPPRLGTPAVGEPELRHRAVADDFDGFCR